MGKTESGAVWLDSEKTSPYEFYQYWRNVDDADVVNCLKILTFLPLGEIDELAKLKGSEINKAKEILAYEVTKLIHGEEEATKAQETAKALFTSKTDTDNMPSTQIDRTIFDSNKISIIDLLVNLKLVPSKGEARRLINQGGISINGEKVLTISESVTLEQFANKGYIIIKKGKKVYHKVTIK